MRFGVALESFTPPGKTPSKEAIVEMARTAEKSGFDSVWAWDHLLLGSRKVFPVFDSLTLLCHVAAKTSRVKIGTSVLIMTLRNPLVLAKILSTLQILSDGRLLLGTATGLYEREFRAVGVDFKRRGKLFEEEFILVKRLLNDSDVNYKSGSVELEHATIEPRVPQYIPMFIGGYSDEVLERAGRLSDGWLSYYYRPDDYRNSWQKVLASAQRHGRNASDLHAIDIVPLSIASSFDEGDRRARDFTSRYMDLPKNTRCTPESAIKGTPRECVEQIKKFQDAGIQNLIFIPVDYDPAQLELASKEILPAFQK